MRRTATDGRRRYIYSGERPTLALIGRLAILSRTKSDVSGARSGPTQCRRHCLLNVGSMSDPRAKC